MLFALKTMSMPSSVGVSGISLKFLRRNAKRIKISKKVKVCVCVSSSFPHAKYAVLGQSLSTFILKEKRWHAHLMSLSCALTYFTSGSPCRLVMEGMKLARVSTACTDLDLSQIHK